MNSHQEFPYSRFQPMESSRSILFWPVRKTSNGPIIPHGASIDRSAEKSLVSR